MEFETLLQQGFRDAVVEIVTWMYEYNPYKTMDVIIYSCSNPCQTTTVKGAPDITHAVSGNGIYVYVDPLC